MKSLISRFRDISDKKENILIRSHNNFPESCEMASSASGYAALVIELNKYFLKNRIPNDELCEYAKIGSGSAGRSIFKGIVYMKNGISSQLCEWNELKVFSLIISKATKKNIIYTRNDTINEYFKLL